MWDDSTNLWKRRWNTSNQEGLNTTYQYVYEAAQAVGEDLPRWLHQCVLKTTIEGVVMGIIAPSRFEIPALTPIADFNLWINQCTLKNHPGEGEKLLCGKGWCCAKRFHVNTGIDDLLYTTRSVFTSTWPRGINPHHDFKLSFCVWSTYCFLRFYQYSTAVLWLFATTVNWKAVLPARI